MTDLNIS